MISKFGDTTEVHDDDIEQAFKQMRIEKAQDKLDAGICVELYDIRDIYYMYDIYDVYDIYDIYDIIPYRCIDVDAGICVELSL